MREMSQAKGQHVARVLRDDLAPNAGGSVWPMLQPGAEGRDMGLLAQCGPRCQGGGGAVDVGNRWQHRCLERGHGQCAFQYMGHDVARV